MDAHCAGGGGVEAGRARVESRRMRTEYLACSQVVQEMGCVSLEISFTQFDLNAVQLCSKLVVRVRRRDLL